MKKVEQPEVDMPVSHPQLINTVPEIIGFWSSEFMTKNLKPFYPSRTSVLNFVWEFVKPFQDRNRFVIFFI